MVNGKTLFVLAFTITNTSILHDGSEYFNIKMKKYVKAQKVTVSEHFLYDPYL